MADTEAAVYGSSGDALLGENAGARDAEALTLDLAVVYAALEEESSGYTWLLSSLNPTNIAFELADAYIHMRDLPLSAPKDILTAARRRLAIAKVAMLNEDKEMNVGAAVLALVATRDFEDMQWRFLQKRFPKTLPPEVSRAECDLRVEANKGRAEGSVLVVARYISRLKAAHPELGMHELPIPRGVRDFVVYTDRDDLKRELAALGQAGTHTGTPHLPLLTALRDKNHIHHHHILRKLSH